MAPLTKTVLLAAAALSGIANAHFQLQAPPALTEDSDLQATGPCGGATLPDFSSDEGFHDFYAGGDAISHRTSHSQENWLYRVTLDEKAETGWTQLFPVVQQNGLGNLCQPRVTVPDEFVGKKGLLSVVGKGHGYLYACAAVNFVAGSREDDVSACTNGTGVSASFVNDAELVKLADPSATGVAPPAATGGHGDDHAEEEEKPDSAAAGLRASLGLGVIVAAVAALL